MFLIIGYCVYRNNAQQKSRTNESLLIIVEFATYINDFEAKHFYWLCCWSFLEFLLIHYYLMNISDKNVIQNRTVLSNYSFIFPWYIFSADIYQRKQSYFASICWIQDIDKLWGQLQNGSVKTRFSQH